MLQSEIVRKYTFSGHETFQCRHLWLKKGYDFVKGKSSFNDEDAVVKLGVGKNMVASIRFWLKAFNIIDAKDALTQFAIKLLDDNGWDPFLEDAEINSFVCLNPQAKHTTHTNKTKAMILSKNL